MTSPQPVSLLVGLPVPQESEDLVNTWPVALSAQLRPGRLGSRSE